jgi:starch phosphorylase
MTHSRHNDLCAAIDPPDGFGNTQSGEQPAMLSTAEILKRYECGPVRFSGDENASYERHLVFDHVIDEGRAHPRQKFEALAWAVRDLLTQRWIKTRRTHAAKNPKRVYYLSMEYLIGRSLTNNIANLLIEPLVQEVLRREGLDLMKLAEWEPDAGLGNGGLGRLAACFIDSLATLQIPAIGYGLRYEYGIFRQEFEHGWQVERPDNWLRRPDPWEVARLEDTKPIKLASGFHLKSGQVIVTPHQETALFGVPFDRPVVGYGGKVINTLRLWGAATPDYFDFGEFSSGDFFAAVSDKVLAETLTRVLYPDDSTASGRSLRFLQEYFLVACSLADITDRFRRYNDDWRTLPDKVAIQLNDTHPALAVAELMQFLLDQIGLGWDEAWDITQRTLAYTNHTLLPEALEKWPVEMFERLLPRHLEIIYEINRRFLNEVRKQHPGDDARIQRMSLIEEGPTRKVRMANLAVVGSHSTNGVAEIHSGLVRTHLLKDFAQMYPERFNNKTNGVTPRRWLLLANPDLARLITDAIGDAWVADLDQLTRLKPLAEDSTFREKFRLAKRKASERFSSWLRSSTGAVVDPDTMFDCQVKRIHEYKRQLLNVLHIVMLYNRLRQNPNLDVPPRTFLFAGKAAPAYTLAKRIIKLINSVAATIDADPTLEGKLKVVFLPNYSVTLSERLIPAADVSEQISTAGYEASGTSNMKFMMNGALTIGTRDGATIEMAAAAGEENFFLFGLTADQVASGRGWYNPLWHYENEPEIRTALDLIFSDHFNAEEPGIFEPIRDTLLRKGDFFMHLADLTAYAQTHEKVGQLYRDRHGWARKAILNVAAAGPFSSDRTIKQYASDIWGAVPCPIDA